MCGWDYDDDGVGFDDADGNYGGGDDSSGAHNVGSDGGDGDGGGIMELIVY